MKNYFLSSTIKKSIKKNTSFILCKIPAKKIFYSSYFALLATTIAGVHSNVFADEAKPFVDSAEKTVSSSGLSKNMLQKEADEFLLLYNSVYKNLYRISQNAEWLAGTDVNNENSAKRVVGNMAMAAFAGNNVIIDKTKYFLKRKNDLKPLQVAQLEEIWLMAAYSPGTIPDIVEALINEESNQSSVLDGFTFCLEKNSSNECKQPITANDIDDFLLDEKDLSKRRKVWNASKEIGIDLKQGLVKLQKLRNQVAREMGYSSFIAYEVADYNMSVDEMMKILDSFVKDVEPLYKELHIWTKRQLAKRYKTSVPKELIPADWIANRWAQEWTGLVDGVNIEPYFEKKTPEWIVKQSENFYVSIGFPKLPESFWSKSDLYALSADSKRKKNTHASAWNIDFGTDLRSLMSVKPTSQWFFTSHHELGHIYYYVSYNNDNIPVVLRTGANRAFHEGIGELISLAASQMPYLKSQGIIPSDLKVDSIQSMLIEALEMTVPMVMWSAGTMSRFEYELYEKNLPPEKWQEKWWEIVKKYQLVDVPDQTRLSDALLCDACTKTHINDDPAQYYDYALATIIKYQLHEVIATKILKQDIHSCNYYGSKKTGDFLKSILEKGKTEDWRTVLKNATGEELSSRALVKYFEPLYNWLKKENQKK